MRSLLKFTLASVFATGTAVVATPIVAQDYPTKPVRIVAGATGTASDYLARYLAQRLYERWAQTMVVDNRAGAGATIAADIVAKAQPDGYTLLMGQLASHAAAVSLYKKLPYDPVRNFAPITLFAQIPLLMTAHPLVPAATLREFIDYAKKRPGAINYSSGSSGTASHLTMALFNVVAGTDLVHVPYKGNGAAMTALLGREVQVSFLPATIAIVQVSAGKLKAYAVTSKTRIAAAPDIPTAAEAGLPGFESTTWFGMFAPARTPADLVGKLNYEIVEILRMPATQASLATQGAMASPGTPEEFAAFIKSEIVKWKKVIEASGARVD